MDLRIDEKEARCSIRFALLIGINYWTYCYNLLVKYLRF